MKYNNIEKYSSVWDLFQSCSKKYSEKDLIIFSNKYSDSKYSYSEFYNQVKKTAEFIVKENIKKGDKIILYGPSSPDWLKIFFSASLLSLVLIPLDLESSKEMIDQVLDETKPKAIFHTNQREFPSKYSFEKKYLLEKLEEYSYNMEEINTREYVKEIDPEDIFELAYTSGTTGNPKGVIVSQKMLTTNLYNGLLIFPIEKNYSALQILPLSHSYAQILNLGIFCIGGKMIIPANISSETIITTLKTHYINTIPGVPRLLDLIKNGIEKKFSEKKAGFIINFLQTVATFLPNSGRRLLFFFIHKQLGGSIKTIIAGGAPLSPSTFSWWENLGVRVIKGYGLTETGPIIAIEDKDNRDPISVGIPIPHQMIKFIKGEIVVKGDHVTQGYYKNEAKNKSTFTEDGWFKTGDLGYLKNGKLFLNGRADEKIILSNGINIYPKDIEFVLNRNLHITDSVIFGVEKKKDIELFAVVLTKKDRVFVSELIKKINNKINANQWIKDFYIWHEEDFPRTHTKKIKRKIITEYINKNILKNE
jgi:long-chain acyl-CoA synthetase